MMVLRQALAELHAMTSDAKSSHASWPGRSSKVHAKSALFPLQSAKCSGSEARRDGRLVISHSLLRCVFQAFRETEVHRADARGLRKQACAGPPSRNELAIHSCHLRLSGTSRCKVEAGRYASACLWMRGEVASDCSTCLKPVILE